MRLYQCPVYLHLHGAEVRTTFHKLHDPITHSAFSPYYVHRLPMQVQFRLLRRVRIWDNRFGYDGGLRAFHVRRIREGCEKEWRWEYELYISRVAWKGTNITGQGQCHRKNHFDQWIMPVPLHYSNHRHYCQIASEITIFKTSLNDYIFAWKVIFITR